MKSFSFITSLLTIFIFCSFVFGQEFELAKFLEETQSVAKKTGYQAFFEFTYDYKRAVEKKDKNTRSETFEAVCSKKRCEYILVAESGKSFSAEKIRKNREKAAKRLEKAETRPEPAYHAKREIPDGYGFMILTNFSRRNSYFNPNLYLKNCKIDFIEKKSIESRSMIKVRATNCNVDKDNNKDFIQFMPKTEAFIWINEQDKAVAKIEVYARKEFDNSTNPGKPLVVMETARVPEGFWFWKYITIEAVENPYFFPESYGNWRLELYNYKPYVVNIDKVEIDKR